MCGGLDAMQTDYYSLYERYFAPRGIAMLTIDMPSVGFSSKWKLTQDSSLLHQHVLKALPNVPWVDHTRVAAFGFRFGAKIVGTSLPNANVIRLLEERSVPPGRGFPLNHFVICRR